MCLHLMCTCIGLLNLTMRRSSVHPDLTDPLTAPLSVKPVKYMNFSVTVNTLQSAVYCIPAV